MTNEELAEAIQNGELELIPQLWEQVERYVKQQANRRVFQLCGRCGVEFEDLYQSGFIAFMAALETFRAGAGMSFINWMTQYLKKAFAEAAGYRTEKQSADPINSALSLSMPLGDDSAATLGDIVPDSTNGTEAAEEQVFQSQLRRALEAALNTLPGDGGELLRLRYFGGQPVRVIAERQGRPVSTINTRIKQAFKILRKSRTGPQLREFLYFDKYRGTGLSSFRRSGESVQEKYIIWKENRSERDQAF